MNKNSKLGEQLANIIKNLQYKFSRNVSADKPVKRPVKFAPLPGRSISIGFCMKIDKITVK